VAPADEIPLPFTGAPVTLVVEDERHGALVEDVDPPHLAIKPVALADRLRMSGEADAVIEFVSDGGPCRLFGTAHVTGEGGRVRFVASGPPQLLLRSERVRAPVEMVIDVELGGELLTGQTRDLRGAGVLIGGPLAVELGDLVRFLLHLPGREKPIDGWGRVARLAADGDVALSFSDMDPDDRAAILLAVFEAQRGGRR
jgi:PilZ domain-containing protein